MHGYARERRYIGRIVRGEARIYGRKCRQFGLNEPNFRLRLRYRSRDVLSIIGADASKRLRRIVNDVKPLIDFVALLVLGLRLGARREREARDSGAKERTAVGRGKKLSLGTPGATALGMLNTIGFHPAPLSL